MADLAPGSTFAGHRIEEVAGRGGMGVVYRATQLALDRTVALKVIAPGLIEDDGMRKRFVRESKVAASIDHPNVIPIYYAGEEGGVAYIAMRYVAGDDLRSLVRRERKLEPRRAARLIAQVAAALDAAHAAGLVHRDVKPANVLLGPDEHVYLTDFGLTKHALSIGGATKPGHWVGTLDYVAPEQIRGERVDARADIYALGCVLYYALTGRVPFDRESDEARLWAHLSEDPPKPSEREQRLSPELDEVIARALAKQPDDRFPSAGDLGRAAVAAAAGERPREHERLVAVGAAAPVDAPTVTSGRLAPTRVQSDDAAEAETRVVQDTSRRRRATLAGVVAIALIAGVAVGALLLNAGDKSPETSGTGTAIPSATGTAAPQSAHATAGKPISVGDRPNVIGANSHAVFVGSFREQRLALVDPKSHKVRRGATIGVGISDMEASDKTVWVVVSRQKRLYRLDPKTGRRRGSAIRLPMQPTSVAVTSRSIWVGLLTDTHTDDELAQIDRRTGEIARTIPIPEGISALAAGDGAIWIANRRRSLVSRFDPRRLAVTRRIPVGSDRPFAIVYGSGAVWVSSPQDGIVTRIDPRSFSTTEIGVGRNPRGLAVRGHAVFVANKTDNTVTRIDAKAGRTVGGPIPVCLNPFAVAIEGDSVWVTCQPRDEVVQIRYEPLTDRGG
jgi:DNA-binding beta-propeller fold protein YncE/predicted Ser/Thr protein kinase